MSEDKVLKFPEGYESKPEVEPEKPRRIRDLTWQTIKLTERLAKMEPNEIVSYSELGKIIERQDVRERNWFLNAARSRAMKAHGIITVAVANVGIKRVIKEGKLAEADKTLKQSRRKATKALAITETVTGAEWTGMDTETKIGFVTTRAVALNMKNESGRAARSRVQLENAKLPELPAFVTR